MIQDSHFLPQNVWGVSKPNENLWFHEIGPWKYKTLEKLAAENINLLLIVLSYFGGSRITYLNQCQSPDQFILFMNCSVFDNNKTTVLNVLQGLNTKLHIYCKYGVFWCCGWLQLPNDVIKMIEKTLNNTCTTTQKQTNNSFHRLPPQHQETPQMWLLCTVYNLWVQKHW